MVHPAVNGVVIDFNVAHQLHDAAVEFRQEERAQQIQRKGDDHPHQHDGAGAAEAGDVAPAPGGAVLGREESQLKKVHRRGKEVGDKRTVKNGGEGTEQLTAEVQQHAPGEERIVKNKDGGHGEKHRKANAEVGFFLHKAPSFRENYFDTIIVPKGGGNCNPVFEVLYLWAMKLTLRLQTLLCMPRRRRKKP